MASIDFYARARLAAKSVSPIPTVYSRPKRPTGAYMVQAAGLGNVSTFRLPVVYGPPKVATGSYGVQRSQGSAIGGVVSGRPNTTRASAGSSPAVSRTYAQPVPLGHGTSFQDIAGLLVGGLLATRATQGVGSAELLAGLTA